MSSFRDLVQDMNGDREKYCEQPLEILRAMEKPPPNIRWNQRDLDETVQHIYRQMHAIILKNVLPAVGKFVESQVKPLRDRIAELEAKIENFHYCGVWGDGCSYKVGNFVTHDGSLWHANEDTNSKPGTDQTWQLAAKRGKDAR